jgi:hypothetical protein
MLVGGTALDGRHDREAAGLGLFGPLDVDFERAVGVVRPGLAVASTLRQSDRARELSKGALVTEEACGVPKLVPCAARSRFLGTRTEF